MTLRLHMCLFGGRLAGLSRDFLARVVAHTIRSGRTTGLSIGAGSHRARDGIAQPAMASTELVGVRNANRSAMALTFHGCLMLVLILSGCATRPAPDFVGRWKSVNRYAASPEEIPLHQSYVFRASPMDGTLRAMLSRWAKDSRMTLSYLHSSDFTLHEPVSKVMTGDIEEAASQLTSAYGGKISVTTDRNTIIVRAAQADAEASTLAP